MTPFTPLDFTESDVLNNISEENIIGSGGSEKEYHPTRLTITIDVFGGLNYIHKECGHAIIHRDIKSGNILVDRKSAISGTHRYMAPDENLKSSKASQTFPLKAN
ncbi:hypothetical protein VPH35_092213 [Triticum aestivum]